MIIDNNKFNLLLNKAKISKSDLCKILSMSSRTIAKISKGEDISKYVIEKLINYFSVEYEDILKTNNVYNTLLKEKNLKLSGGLYHETQIRLTYNSNHIEGSSLTEEQTRYIFETHTIGELSSNVRVDDIVETNNHFKCIDYIIDFANLELDENFILNLQKLLKQGTNYSEFFGAGKYKQQPNTVGGIETTEPENVKFEMQQLLNWYKTLKKVALEDIVEFHFKFERIHPFQDGNGRVGRLIMFKECLKNNIVPFYIDDRFKAQYYNGLNKYSEDKNFLIETCKFGQDLYKQLLDYFKVEY